MTIPVRIALWGACGALACAQWIDYPTPGTPRFPNGKANLSAPPRRN